MTILPGEATVERLCIIRHPSGCENLIQHFFCVCLPFHVILNNFKIFIMHHYHQLAWRHVFKIKNTSVRRWWNETMLVVARRYFKQQKKIECLLLLEIRIHFKKGKCSFSQFIKFINRSRKKWVFRRAPTPEAKDQSLPHKINVEIISESF